jgi:uncharacterized protein YqeY
MTLKTQFENDLKDAMRGGDEVRKTTIRGVIAAIKLAMVEKGAELDDTTVLALVQKEVKSRRESIADAEKANRPDLIASALAEIKILETYLPAQMSEDELRSLTAAAIAEVGALLPTDMGKVMKVLMPKVQGRAANDQISRMVRSLLEKA